MLPGSGLSVGAGIPQHSCCCCPLAAWVAADTGKQKLGLNTAYQTAERGIRRRRGKK